MEQPAKRARAKAPDVDDAVAVADGDTNKGGKEGGELDEDEDDCDDGVAAVADEDEDDDGAAAAADEDEDDDGAVAAADEDEDGGTGGGKGGSGSEDDRKLDPSQYGANTPTGKGVRITKLKVDGVWYYIKRLNAADSEDDE
jgi:hypothetical protein